MISIKLLNLLTVGGVALFVCSLAPTANALAEVSKHQRLNRLAAHEGIAKRATRSKRSLTRRCKTRDSNSTSTGAVASTSYSSSYVTPSSTYVATTDYSSSSSVYVPTTSDTPVYTPTSSSSTSVASPTSSSSGSGKIGLAWTGSNDGELASFATSQTKYVYTWSAYKPDNCDQLGLQFWPMLHDASSVSDFESNVVAGYGTNILGPNEPELNGLDPATAVTLWTQYIQPKEAMGYGLISPAVSSASSGIPWMQQFIQECGGACQFTAGCALHYYGTDANDFITYVENFYNTFQGSCSVIHVTEFACQDFSGGAQADESQVWAFYQQAISWLDSTSYIGSYFAFGVLDNMDGVNQLDALLENGAPTSLGYAYIYNSW